MERNVVIAGLSRQAQFMGLPLPYALAVGAFWFLPFIWFGSLLWLLSLPFFYLVARILVGINPNGHRVFYVMARRLRVNILAPRSGNRDYV